MTPKILKIIAATVAIGFGIKLVFGLTMVVAIQSFLAQESARYPSQKKETKYIAGAVPELPELVHSSELPQPLLHKDRALLSYKLKGVMGYGTEGWKLRYNTKADRTILRPDLANCLRSPEPDCYPISKRFNAEVFAKGKQRIYVNIRHMGSDIFGNMASDEREVLRKQFPSNRWGLVMPNYATDEYLRKEWKDIAPWNGFTMERMENHGGKGSYFLKATLEDDSTVVLNILTNAPIDEVKSQLAAMDLDMLRALVSPIPFDGYDTLDAYVNAVMSKRAGKNRFDVLSQDALVAKVTNMPSDQRLQYAKQIVDHAQRNNNALSDYNILYHPEGANGQRDTRAFLAGEINEDDPRYSVLEEEHRRDYPVGTCLLTNVGQACRTEAESIRIGAYLVTQAALKQANEPLDGEQPYSEQAFQNGMQKIEAQMDEALQRLVQLRGAD